MSTVICDTGEVHIPEWVVDLSSFRTWIHSPEVPEEARCFYLAGDVVVDMTKQQIFTHSRLKQEFNFVVDGAVRASESGLYLPDGVLFTNLDADLSSQPDGIYVSNDSFESGRVKLVQGAKEGFVEYEGSPDLVIEVVSDGSVKKDTVVLLELYWRAGVREYWLADARKNCLSFKIMESTELGFVEAADDLGWRTSKVLGKQFRLSQRTDARGFPSYVLEMR